jgi:hypothetical protein
MLKRFLITVFICLICTSIYGQTGPSFESFFFDKTMRLDYIHTGTHDKEYYSYDAIYEELSWAGSQTNLIDTLSLGKYLFKVTDRQTKMLLYSRGFCSIFGEWQTTDEAKKSVWRSFSESVRFPWPRFPVSVTIAARDSMNIFRDIWTLDIDPLEPNIRRTGFYPEFKVDKIIDSGDPHDKVDLLILPDGYTKREMKKFRKDTQRLLKTFFETSPFKKHKKDFNVWAVEAPSNQSGIDNPRSGVYVDNILSCSFNAFGSDRYVLSWDNQTIRKIASRAPYDHLLLLINSNKYGGGGIFNLYSTCTSDKKWSGYIFVHEMGHSFGGLADEYYTSDVAYDEFYPAGVEPWEPNITALLDTSHAKWQDMIEPGTAIPTPWDKNEFDEKQTAYRKLLGKMREREAPKVQIDSLTAANDQWVHIFLRNLKYWNKVGVYEGGGYASSGLYRPFIDCRMFSRSLTGFCPVCTRAIEEVIDFYTK